MDIRIELEKDDEILINIIELTLEFEILYTRRDEE